MPVKALGDALATGRARGYQQTTPQPQTPPRNFFGRLVARIFGKNNPEPTYQPASVASHLQQDYGPKIGNTLMQKVGNRPLTARRVVALHKQALKLKNQVDQSNARHLRSSLNLDRPGSMVRELFYQTQGFPVSQLADYEREKLQTTLEQACHRWGDHKLSRDEVRGIASDVLIGTPSGFAAAAPATSRLFGADSHPFYGRAMGLWQNGQSLSFKQKNVLNAFRYNTDYSARLQYQSPFDSLDNRDWAGQLEDVQTHIQRLGQAQWVLQRDTELELGEPLRGTMVRDIGHQLEMANQHESYLRHLATTDFRSHSNQVAVVKRHLATALLIVDQEMERTIKKVEHNPQSTRAQEKLSRLAQTYDALLQRQLSVQDSPRADMVSMKKWVQADLKNIQQQLVDAGIAKRGLGKRWNKAAVAVTNASSWGEISKPLQVRVEGNSHNYTSTLIPASRMRLHRHGQGQGERDPFTVSYLDGGRSSSATSEPVHMINMYDTRLSDAKGNILYEGLRSGTLYPRKVKTEAKREQIMASRARELLTAAVVKKLSGLTPEQQEQVLSSGNISVDLLSTSLMTPDNMRHLTHLHDDERRYQENQHRVLKELCSAPVTLELVDSQGNPTQIKTRVRLAELNLPVNRLGLNSAYATAGQTWQKADGYNREGLGVLLGNTHPDADIDGIAGDWLRQHEASEPEKAAIVRQLAYQVRTLFSQKQHHSVGRDAYKLMERVQLLGWMTGAVTHFNCKSGKDRTGEADARIKVLAAEIQRLGHVPDPLAPQGPEHREAVQSFLYGTGNLEVQQQNVNAPGYKTGYGKAEQGRGLYRLIH